MLLTESKFIHTINTASMPSTRQIINSVVAVLYKVNFYISKLQKAKTKNVHLGVYIVVARHWYRVVNGLPTTPLIHARNNLALPPRESAHHGSPYFRDQGRIQGGDMGGGQMTPPPFSLKMMASFRKFEPFSLTKLQLFQTFSSYCSIRHSKLTPKFKI